MLRASAKSFYRLTWLADVLVSGLLFTVLISFEQMHRTILRRAELQGKMELFNRGLRVVDVAKRRIGVNLGRLVFREVHQLLGGQLRYAFSGGAALKPEIAQAFFKLGLMMVKIAPPNGELVSIFSW